jgi:phage portal protein BeeE
MNPIKKLFKGFSKSKAIGEELSIKNSEGWTSIGGASLYETYKNNDYENAYPSISKIANGFLSIQPYAIDENGNKVKENNVVDRLYFPNQQMSAVDFREALAVMSLVHDRVFIRVHYKGQKSSRGINPNFVTGYTFLENCHPVIVEDRLTFILPNGETIDDSEVIVLKDINPYRLEQGFSPTRAAKRWVRIDDYISDYQAGFFRNGAVPSGMFIITAKTVTDYKDIKANMQKYHQGAGKNNNVMYNYRPADVNGQKQDSQIEWVPFNTTNKEMGLKDLFDQVNQKVDSTYGVPSSIRGVNDNNTYASVRVDEVIFVDYTLRPRTMKIWGKMSHELARITGGFGAAITFDLATPQIADEEKVKAEARQVKVTTLNTLTDKGYTLESVIEYLDTDDLTKLVMSNKKPVTPATTTDEEEVDEGSEVTDSPNENEGQKKLKVKQFSEVDRENYEQQLANVVRSHMRKQVNNVIETFDLASKAITPEEPIEQEEDIALADDMLSVLLAAIMLMGLNDQESNLSLVFEAGINIGKVSEFHLTEAQRKQYTDYIRKVAKTYNAETAEKIRTILREGRVNGLSSQQISSSLEGIISEEWRIKRIAVSEVNRAGNESSIISMENIADETGADIEKVWEHDGGDSPCQFCQAMIGSVEPLRRNFVDYGGTVVGTDGGIFVNNFVPIRVAELHPNGHCRQTYRVRSR